MTRRWETAIRFLNLSDDRPIDRAAQGCFCKIPRGIGLPFVAEGELEPDVRAGVPGGDCFAVPDRIRVFDGDRRGQDFAHIRIVEPNIADGATVRI